jgi:hypothetical protein
MDSTVKVLPSGRTSSTAFSWAFIPGEALWEEETGDRFRGFREVGRDWDFVCDRSRGPDQGNHGARGEGGSRRTTEHAERTERGGREGSARTGSRVMGDGGEGKGEAQEVQPARAGRPVRAVVERRCV